MSENKYTFKRQKFETQVNYNHSPTAFEYSHKPAHAEQNHSVNLPGTVLYATSPQELSYAILTGDKIYYSKQELLMIINRLDKMLSPQFNKDCVYIN